MSRVIQQIPGLFNILQGPHEKTKSQEWLGRKEAHLTGHIGDLEPIEESEQKAVEDSKCSGSLSLADLTGIFTQGDIPSPMEAILNGIITNDKFCLSQIRHLPKRSARKGFPQEIQYPSEATEEIRCPKVEIYEETTVEHSPLHQRDSRRTASLGSSLSTTPASQCSTSGTRHAGDPTPGAFA